MPACARSSYLPEVGTSALVALVTVLRKLKGKPGASQVGMGCWTEQWGRSQGAGKAGGKVGHARKGTAHLQKKRCLSSGHGNQGFIQTHLCGFPVGVFTSHVTTRIRQCLA